MQVTAITREISPSINDCELSYHAREPINLAKAVAQHRSYCDCLAHLGAHVVMLPAEAKLPDAVFVEDPVVVVDEVAVLLNMGAASRRPEAKSLGDALARFRPLKFLREPGTMDGGDVLRIGKSIFVGQSRRTNRAGVEQLRDFLRDHGYDVQPVPVHGCLHLKSACSHIGRNTVLLNRAWIDADGLRDFELVEVAEEEPAAANALLLNDTIIMPDSFPKTRALLEERGFQVRALDVSELQKAEAGVTCCSVILNTSAPGRDRP